MSDLRQELATLSVQAAEAVKAGDMDTMLALAGQIASMKKQIDGEAKAAAEAKRAANQAEIDKVKLTIEARFVKSLQASMRDLERLGELDAIPEVLRFTVEYPTGAQTIVFHVGALKARKASAGTGATKSRRHVTLHDTGEVMDTKEYVLKYFGEVLTSEEQARVKATFDKWPTALADKVATKRGDTVA